MSMHRTASRSRQRGLSFFGLIFVGLFAVAAFAIGGQSVPIFLEYTSAKKAIENETHFYYGATVSKLELIKYIV